MRARQLAADLRRLREAEMMTGEQAAARLGWSASKISRIETAQNAVEVADLERLLDLYQVSGSERDRLAELHRSVDENRRGWWDAYADTLGHGYPAMIALESNAESESQYIATLIPGLLQTEAYARAIIASSLVPTSEKQVQQRVQVRLKRQRELVKDNPLELDVVLDEAVFLRQVGGPQVMKEQLLHLIEMAAPLNISIQVLPFSTGPHPAIAGSFAILSFSGSVATRVVYLENMTSELFIEDPGQVNTYFDAFNRLREIALSQPESISLINKMASGIR
jgi:transcriptional regulator with XRE-family HTH domain